MGTLLESEGQLAGSIPARFVMKQLRKNANNKENEMITEALNEIEQGSDEWKLVRRGVPTASCFDKILTPTTLKLSSSYDGYLNQLAAESVGLYEDWKGNGNTERGSELEPEAAFYYEFTNSVITQKTGFIWRDERRLVGGSPDLLVGDDGGVEIKCPSAKVHIGYLRKGDVPSEYLGQVYGYLWITGRQWWDFVSYYPGFKKNLEVRIHADDEAYQKWRAVWEHEIELFCEKLEVVKGMVAEWWGGE